MQIMLGIFALDYVRCFNNIGINKVSQHEILCSFYIVSSVLVFENIHSIMKLMMHHFEHIDDSNNF